MTPITFTAWPAGMQPIQWDWRSKLTTLTFSAHLDYPTVQAFGHMLDAQDRDEGELIVTIQVVFKRRENV